ncbi:hypothetical protein BGW39_000984 [Mortierella sp. 14UC]|nr:hypothetical protein BGW39_000984 [Mortierella sp. 14UC]
MTLDTDQENIIRKYREHKIHVACSRCYSKGRFQRSLEGRLHFTCTGIYPDASGNPDTCNKHFTEAVMEGLLDEVIASRSIDENKNRRTSNAGSSALSGSSSAAAGGATAATSRVSTYDACGSLLPATLPASGDEISAFFEQRIIADEYVIQTYRDIKMELKDKLERHYQNLLFYLRLDLFLPWLRAHSMNTGTNLYFRSASSTDGTNKETDDFSKILEVFPPGTKFSMTHRCEYCNLWPELTKEDLEATAGIPRKVNGPDYPANKTFRPSQSAGFGCHGSVESAVEWVRLVNDGPLVGLCRVTYRVCCGHRIGQRRRMYVARTKASSLRGGPRKYGLGFGGFGDLNDDNSFFGSNFNFGEVHGSDYEDDVAGLSREEAQLTARARGGRSNGVLPSHATTLPIAVCQSSVEGINTANNFIDCVRTFNGIIFSWTLDIAFFVFWTVVIVFGPASVPSPVLNKFVEMTLAGTPISADLMEFLREKLSSAAAGSLSATRTPRDVHGIIENADDIHAFFGSTIDSSLFCWIFFAFFPWIVFFVCCSWTIDIRFNHIWIAKAFIVVNTN